MITIDYFLPWLVQKESFDCFFIHNIGNILRQMDITFEMFGIKDEI
jgi:hypothetical protein